MNFFLLASGLFLALVMIFVLPRKIEEFKVHKWGTLVTVNVKKLPDCTRRYKNKFVRIEYNGTVHSVRTKCIYVRGLMLGQGLKMLHKPGTDIFLFKEEQVTSELASVILLAMILIACMVKSLWNNKNKHTQ